MCEFHSREIHTDQLECFALIDVANYVIFSFLLSGYSVYMSESVVACASLRAAYKMLLPVLVHLPARCVLWF